MPKGITSGVIFTLNAVDLSARVKSISIKRVPRAPVNLTAMTDTDEDLEKVPIKGTKIALTFFQDYAASQVYATLKALDDAAGSQTLTYRPSTAIQSATNPTWSMSVLLDGEFPYHDASDVGAANMVPVNFVIDGAVSYLTSASS